MLDCNCSKIMVLVYIPSFAAPSRICRGLESPPSLRFYSAALRLIMDLEVSGHKGYILCVHLVTISKHKCLGVKL